MNQTANLLLPIVGHDLCQPINTLIKFSHLLENHIAAGDTEKVREYTGLIGRSAQYGHELLEQILDWTNQANYARTPGRRMSI